MFSFLPTGSQSTEEECRRLREALAEQARDRELLAFDIHDGLSQYLAGAILHLEACRPSASDPAIAAKITEALRLIRKADAEARRLMSDRRPPALDDEGLVAAFDTLVADARLQGIDVQVTRDVPDAALPTDVAVAIYRIVQEAVTNARRHAAARTVSVVLDRCQAGLRLRVRDDGSGFDPAAVAEGRFGLEGIRRRARLHGGTVEIDSRAGAGTTIEIVLPA